MRINADFNLPARVEIAEEDFIASPAAGVDRLMLDRIGDEVARATSIVRYAAGSVFAEHAHAMGEEFLVLDGVFSDEHGHYAEGCYVRNPPGTSHSPFSDEGCTIFVKLRQFAADDLVPVVIDTAKQAMWVGEDTDRAINLHEHGGERVCLRRLAAGQTITLAAPDGGLEWLLLEGNCRIDGVGTAARCWQRLPAGSSAICETTSVCLIWSKEGHLPVEGEGFGE